ncbi:unnamed protein product [Paramecium primaurelia]|uniref:Uncharacterized protein n=1 Tax=Paramecium primaurelia TaxID=5886 RepID=A0A8S1KXT0_PARPR|nr:unnamed protein product [Paramecium primaurelia]
MKPVWRLILILFQINGLGFSIYYYITSLENTNLVYLIIQALFFFFLFFLQTKNKTTLLIGSLILIQLSLCLYLIQNERNSQNQSTAYVIIVHFITTHLFKDFIRFQKQLFRCRLFWLVLLVQSSCLQILYIYQTQQMDISFYQCIIYLLFSLVINFANGMKKFFIPKNKQSDQQHNQNIDQIITRKDRASSQLDTDKMSPKSKEYPFYNFLMPDYQFPKHVLNQNILDVMMEFTHEGLVVLRLNQLNQEMEIVFSNVASKTLFSANSAKEIIDIFNSLNNIKYQKHDSQEDNLLIINQQKQLCKSMAFLKNDLINQSINPNFQGLLEFNQENNIVKQFKEIFSKFKQNSPQNEFFTLHTFYPNNGMTLSSNEKKAEKMLELTITKKENNLFFILIRDITHKQKIKYLREYDLQKSKMLSYVSHEYRSPLNCIIQMIENVLHTNQLTMDNTEMLQAALDNSYYILNLSNDLLDLAQIKNGKFAIQQTKFNLEQLIKECLKLFALKAKILKLNISYKYDNAAPSIVLSDRNRIKQILVNLLSNSFKFTSSQITILVSYIDNKTIRIGVQDNGIGISDEDQKKLFKQFSKVNSEESRKRNENGVGLGLVISNQIASSIGCGGLQIDSKLNQGTYFFFNMQIQSTRLRKVSSCRIKENSGQSQEVDEGQAFLLEPQKSIDQKSAIIRCSHILIVDDEIFNVFTFTKLLNKKKILDIDSASNGSECIEKLKNKKCSQTCSGYKLIFMDLEMPILNGFNASKEALKINPNQIIIACSGYTDQKEKEECKKIGVLNYLVKPIRDQELNDILKEYYF